MAADQSRSGGSGSSDNILAKYWEETAAVLIVIGAILLFIPFANPLGIVLVIVGVLLWLWGWIRG
jgi:hypothetical protein